MDPTEQRLRELFADGFDDDRPPAELWQATRTRVRRRAARRQLAVAASGVAGVVILGLGIPAVVASLRTEHVEFVQTPATAESTAQAAPAPDPQASGSEPGALRHGPARLRALAVAADRLVALGMDASGSAGMWTSADGRDWILAPTQTSEPFSGLNAGDLETAGLAARDSSAVAFADDVRSAPRFWAAGAGDAAWSEVEVDPAGFAGATVMAVTADRAGLVAVGFEGDIEIPETWHAAVWNSTDGRDWRRAPDVGEQFDGDIMELVTAGGPGFVAVGSDPKGTHVWTSSDGREWVRDRLHLTSQEGLSLRVVALSSHGPDIAAIGYTDAADAFLLRSSDAATWSETRLPPEIFARMTVRGMVEFDGRLVVVGEDEFGATVWESPDGADWTLLSGAVTAAGSEQPLGLPSMKTRLTHGDPAFAVYLSVAHEPDAPQLETAGERLRAIGYAADPVDVACDRGAQEALGLDPHERYSGIALYFETEADAWQFVQAWKQRFRVGVVGVAEVQTFCAG